MKLTRRELVIAAAGSVAAVNAAAQAVPAAAPVDLNAQALSDLQQNADDLAKIVIPMDVAPAFQFKA